MSIASLLVRFALLYIALLVAIALVVKGLLGIEGNSGINTAALIGAVMAACSWFVHRNQRDFTREEKKRAVLGMLAIDLVLQAAVSATLLFGAGTGNAIGPWLFALLFIGALHAIGIWVFAGLAGKQYAKALERDAKKKAEKAEKAT